MSRLLASAVATAIAISVWVDCAGAANNEPLALESEIPLGNVRGRIDHLAVDLNRKRLFVAELGNNSVSVVDLNGGKVAHRIVGLREPKGVGYVPSTDMLYVANAGDGSVRLFAGEDYAPAGQIDLGKDADNIRVDFSTNLVLVGYGDGGIAIIDPLNRQKIGDIPLKVHPEGFQIARDADQIFVNLTSAHSLAVIDRKSGREAASWAMTGASGNFPMALDEVARRVLVVFRNPAKLRAFDMASGAGVADRETCGDADDLFVDTARKRIYVSCGDGFIDVLDAQAPAYPRLARIPTVRGARTSLFIPAMDRLALAVRASGSEQAAIRIYRALP